jgi:hypothetical protein
MAETAFISWSTYPTVLGTRMADDRVNVGACGSASDDSRRMTNGTSQTEQAVGNDIPGHCGPRASRRSGEGEGE